MAAKEELCWCGWLRTNGKPHTHNPNFDDGFTPVPTAEEEPMTKEELVEALDSLHERGLVDVFLNDEGEWYYVPTELGLKVHEIYKNT